VLPTARSARVPIIAKATWALRSWDRIGLTGFSDRRRVAAAAVRREVPVIVVVEPADELFGEVSGLFDDYRVHYGHASAPERTRRWLHGQVDSGRFRIAAAVGGGRVAGFITNTVIPASLTLGTAWLIRDLYVAPELRRSGTARALVDNVVRDAHASGAIRVSLQTESGNRPALALYLAVGFEPVAGIGLLNLALADDYAE
jgi:GNAT superfamily N-acetyltransferase